MRTEKKNIYYCDHCKKRGLSAPAISKHEKHCTANPKRICRMCSGTDLEEIVEEFKKRFTLTPINSDFIFAETDFKVDWIGKPVTIEEIIDSVDGCPNCTLAVLRQCKFNYSYFDFKYDYKKEVENYWVERNKDEQRNDYFLGIM